MRGFMQGRRAAYSMPLQTLFLLVAFYLLAVQLVIPKIQEKQTVMETETYDPQRVEKLEDSLTAILADAAIIKLKQDLAEALPADSLKSNERLEEEEEHVTILGIGLNSSQFGEKLDTYIRDIPFLGRVWELL